MTSIDCTWLQCSSQAKLNEAFLKMAKEAEQGHLDRLHFSTFWEKHEIPVQPLDQIASNATNCTKLDVSNLFTTEGNRKALLQMAGQICSSARQLTELQVSNTQTSVDDGKCFLETLQASAITNLETICMEQTPLWFENE